MPRSVLLALADYLYAELHYVRQTGSPGYSIDRKVAYQEHIATLLNSVIMVLEAQEAGHALATPHHPTLGQPGHGGSE